MDHALTRDIVGRIASFTTINELLNCAPVSRRLRAEFDSDSVWRPRLQPVLRVVERQQASMNADASVPPHEIDARLGVPARDRAAAVRGPFPVPSTVEVARMFAAHAEVVRKLGAPVRVTAVVHPSVPDRRFFHIKHLRVHERPAHRNSNEIDHDLRGGAVPLVTWCAIVKLGVDERGAWRIVAWATSAGMRWWWSTSHGGDRVRYWHEAGETELDYEEQERDILRSVYNLHGDGVEEDVERDMPARHHQLEARPPQLLLLLQPGSVTGYSDKRRYIALLGCSQHGARRCSGLLTRPPPLLSDGTLRSGKHGNIYQQYPLLRPLPLCLPCRRLISAAFTVIGGLPLTRVYRVNEYEYDVRDTPYLRPGSGTSSRVVVRADGTVHRSAPRVPVRQYRIRVVWRSAPVDRFEVESHEVVDMCYARGAEDNC